MDFGPKNPLIWPIWRSNLADISLLTGIAIAISVNSPGDTQLKIWPKTAKSAFENIRKIADFLLNFRSTQKMISQILAKFCRSGKTRIFKRRKLCFIVRFKKRQSMD
jgi:hypothetical protein